LLRIWDFLEGLQQHLEVSNTFKMILEANLQQLWEGLRHL